MDDYTTTDLGFITKTNANYLYRQGIINEKGGIVGNRVQGVGDKPVIMYSHFRSILQDTLSRIPTLPEGVHLDLDNLIDLLREGYISIPVDEEKKRYYTARINAVDNIKNRGLEVARGFGKKTDSKKTDFSDLGWDD